MATTILFIAGLMLAYANGANDNFKGVATLFGSATTSYRRALAWATATTMLGSLLAVLLAGQMLERFTGKGIVPAEVAAEPRYLAAVAAAAGLTVLLATRLGMPVSTTHALVGALAGAGIASATRVNWASLSFGFFAPLLFSPVLALAATAGLYPALRWARQTLGITKQTCFCVGTEPVELVPVLSPTLAIQRVEQLTASFGTAVTCQERYTGHLFGVNCARALDLVHYMSAGLVSFARGLNDTPKIAALLLALPHFGPLSTTALCGLLIAAGGILSARRVAETVSHRITSMNAGQGFTANLITGLVVVAASRWGLPVSTTHVSCGSLFGLGTVIGRARWGLIGTILLAWVSTLPVAVLLGWALYRTLAVLAVINLLK